MVKEDDSFVTQKTENQSYREKEISKQARVINIQRQEISQ